MSEEEERALYEEEYRSIADVEDHFLPQKAREFFEAELNANKERLQRVERFLSPEARILEIGCAAGSFLYLAKAAVSECTGLELHKAYSRFVRDELGIPTYDVPLEECLFPSERFDAIFLFHVLEHLRDPGSYLVLLHSILRTGGSVFIELPNVDDALLTIYRLDSYRAFYYQPAHNYYFSRQTLSRMLREAGFRAKPGMMQRYGLSNHLNWVFRGKPQAQPAFKSGLPLLLLDYPYRGLLRLTGRADTLFAIAQKE
jgi:2-polyprenyl-3-methyl-5-hydroxy-6-metoxy-1,4-benzoquinol methylase